MTSDAKRLQISQHAPPNIWVVPDVSVSWRTRAIRLKGRKMGGADWYWWMLNQSRSLCKMDVAEIKLFAGTLEKSILGPRIVGKSLDSNRNFLLQRSGYSSRVPESHRIQNPSDFTAPRSQTKTQVDLRTRASTHAPPGTSVPQWG